MEISPLQTTTTVDLPPASESSNTVTDYELFLEMLTAQLKYQDPLEPMDSTDYASQLAELSNVEQAVLTNDLLEDLIAQMTTGGLTDMAALVGKEARATGSTYFDGTPITLTPVSASSADTVEIIVRDASGAEVQRIPLALDADTAEWAGVDAGGVRMPNGLYSFETVSSLNGEVVSQTPIEVYSAVVEVRRDGDQTMLVLEGGALVPSDQVTAFRDPV